MDAFPLRYRLFLNVEAAVPIATFIIQTYAEEFAAKFTTVDLWVIRDLKQNDEIIARNRTVPPRVSLSEVLHPSPLTGKRPASPVAHRRRSTDR